MKYLCGLLVLTVVVSMVVAGPTHYEVKRQVPGADQAQGGAQMAAGAAGQAAEMAKTGIDTVKGAAETAAGSIPGRR